MKPVLDQSWVEHCLERGREVLKREAEALQDMEGRLDRSFAEAALSTEIAGAIALVDAAQDPEIRAHAAAALYQATALPAPRRC